MPMIDTEKNAKKEVMIKIKGVHKNVNNNEKSTSYALENTDYSELTKNITETENVVKTECRGFYQKIGEQLYIKYTEKVEDEIISNTLLKVNTIKNNINNNINKNNINSKSINDRNINDTQRDYTKVEIVKKGVVNSKMTFIENVKTKTVYSTPYGKFNIIINTDKIDVNKKEDMLFIIITYDLMMNDEPVSKAEIEIRIEFI